MPPRKKYKDYETAMTRLDDITERLESGEVKLEEAIELYSEGLEIARFCTRKLSEAEKKIKIIAEKNGLITEREFGEEEE
jgi:exodeoxyribonuclease VII small subunit